MLNSSALKRYDLFYHITAMPVLATFIHFHDLTNWSNISQVQFKNLTLSLCHLGISMGQQGGGYFTKPIRAWSVCSQSPKPPCLCHIPSVELYINHVLLLGLIFWGEIWHNMCSLIKVCLPFNIGPVVRRPISPVELSVLGWLGAGWFNVSDGNIVNAVVVLQSCDKFT